MQKLWDPSFLKGQIRKFRAQAKSAVHPDVAAVYHSYVQHYEAMLAALRARSSAPAPENR
jgi:hypothetical protein